MKHFALTEENQNLFNELFEDTGLHNFMQLSIIGVTKSKELIKVARPNEYAKYVGKLPDYVVVIAVYEEAFDRLDDKNKRLLIKDAFNLISYDSEKDKITIGAPQIVVTVDGRQTYDTDLINAAELGVKMIEDIETEKREAKEAEKARKAAEKAAKKQKK